MGFAKFEYLAPKSVREACSLLSRYKGKARVIAGGTDLLINMDNREATPDYLVGLRNIPNLGYIKQDAARGLKIGALATHGDIASSPLVRDRFSILADAASKVGTPQIRNQATIGGNLCNGAPSADTASPLLALGASVKLVSVRGERIVPLQQFFTGALKTCLEPDEILTEIRVPRQPAGARGVYIKLCARGAEIDIATLGVAVVITPAKDNTFADARIALGTAAPTPMRAGKAEALLIGKRIEDGAIEKAAQAAMDESRPRTSMRSTAEYRKRMVKVLTKRAIKQALAAAG